MEDINEYEVFAKSMEEKYPKMLSGKYGGFAIGKGWWIIIDKLMMNIQHHIDHKTKQRQREIDTFNARELGYDALIEFYSGARHPSDWEIERAQEVMENGVVIPPEVSQVIVQQIKEKFGGLRFYYDGGDEYVHGLVSMAESWADIACEECGGIGQRRSGGWIRTLCDKHEAEHQEKLKLRNQND
jgi:hypothetical protein